MANIEIKLDKKAKVTVSQTADIGGGVEPTGTIDITENGEYDVKTVATANVNVSGTSLDQYSDGDILKVATSSGATTTKTLTGPYSLDDYTHYTTDSLGALLKDEITDNYDTAILLDEIKSLTTAPSGKLDISESVYFNSYNDSILASSSGMLSTIPYSENNEILDFFEVSSGAIYELFEKQDPSSVIADDEVTYDKVGFAHFADNDGYPIKLSDLASSSNSHFTFSVDRLPISDIINAPKVPTAVKEKLSEYKELFVYQVGDPTPPSPELENCKFYALTSGEVFECDIPGKYYSDESEDVAYQTAVLVLTNTHQADNLDGYVLEEESENAYFQYHASSGQYIGFGLADFDGEAFYVAGSSGELYKVADAAEMGWDFQVGAYYTFDSDSHYQRVGFSDNTFYTGYSSGQYLCEVATIHGPGQGLYTVNQYSAAEKITLPTSGNPTEFTFNGNTYTVTLND